MKLITFTVPCYNSAAYMDRCVETLLPAGEELLPFYTRLGFAPLGEAGQFFLPQQNNLEET